MTTNKIQDKGFKTTFPKIAANSTYGNFTISSYKGTMATIAVAPVIENHLNVDVANPTINSYLANLLDGSGARAVRINPGSPSEGDIQLDKPNKRIYCYVSGAWRQIYPAAYAS